MEIALPRRRWAVVRRLVGAQGLLWPPFTAAIVTIAALRLLCGKAVDPDYWWHLAAGRWMLDHGRVPHVDPFSITHGGQSWVAHEWLAELAFAAANRLGGYALALALTVLMLGVGCALLWQAARLYGATRRSATTGVAIAFFYIAVAVAVRPQVWVFVLLLALLHELAAHDAGARRRLWHLPLLFVLAINLNLLALAGGLMLALYAVHRTVVWLRAGGAARAEERARLRHVLMVGALSALALNVNPRGPALFLFVLRYIQPHALRLRYIQEWEPLPFSGYDAALYLGGAALLAFTLFGMMRRRTLWPGVLALAFAVPAARSGRYMPLFGISAALAYVWLAAGMRSAATAEEETPRTRHLGALSIAAGLIAALALLRFAPGQFRRVPDATRGGYPVAAAAWLRDDLPGARLFNEYNWGGYLDDALYPRPNVFIDGREEMYGDALFGTYIATMAARAGWEQTLAAWRVDAVIVKPHSPLARALAGDPGWHKAFADTTAVIYVPAR